jgi:hypothetical protein
MKNKVGLIVPVLMLVFGAYMLLTAFSTGGEQVRLISDHQIPRGLAIMFGLICLGGGVVVIMTALSKKNSRVVSE